MAGEGLARVITPWDLRGRDGLLGVTTSKETVRYVTRNRGLEWEREQVAHDVFLCQGT